MEPLAHFSQWISHHVIHMEATSYSHCTSGPGSWVDNLLLSLHNTDGGNETPLADHGYLTTIAQVHHGEAKPYTQVDFERPDLVGGGRQGLALWDCRQLVDGRSVSDRIVEVV